MSPLVHWFMSSSVQGLVRSIREFIHTIRNGFDKLNPVPQYERRITPYSSRFTFHVSHFTSCVSFVLFCLFVSSCSTKQIPSPIERSEAPDAIAEPLTMAMLYFENIVEDESLYPLRAFLLDAFIQKLSPSQTFKIVEREELDRIMGELRLNESAAIDPETAQKIGKLLGAQTVFNGGFFRLGKQLYLNGHLYRVETGEVITSLGGHSRHEDGKVLRQLIQNLANEMMTIIEEQKFALQADIWYERGRNAEADGDREKAKQMYLLALTIDPNHIPSQKKLGIYQFDWRKEKVVIAVLPFSLESENEEFQPLSLGLIDLFTTALSKSPQLRIVERQRLRVIMAELDLNQRAVIDPETQQRLGKILGAPLLCYGSVVDFWGEAEVTVKLTRTETGEMIAKGEHGDSDRLPEELSQRVEKIAKEIRDDVEKNHSHLIADLYYERGRNAEADEDYEKAVQMYKYALETNKKHAKAKEALERLSPSGN